MRAPLCASTVAVTVLLLCILATGPCDGAIPKYKGTLLKNRIQKLSREITQMKMVLAGEKSSMAMESSRLQESSEGVSSELDKINLKRWKDFSAGKKNPKKASLNEKQKKEVREAKQILMAEKAVKSKSSFGPQGVPMIPGYQAFRVPGDAVIKPFSESPMAKAMRERQNLRRHHVKGVGKGRDRKKGKHHTALGEKHPKVPRAVAASLEKEAADNRKLRQQNAELRENLNEEINAHPDPYASMLAPLPDGSVSGREPSETLAPRAVQDHASAKPFLPMDSVSYQPGDDTPEAAGSMPIVRTELALDEVPSNGDEEYESEAEAEAEVEGGATNGDDGDAEAESEAEAEEEGNGASEGEAESEGGAQPEANGISAESAEEAEEVSTEEAEEEGEAAYQEGVEDGKSDDDLDAVTAETDGEAEAEADSQQDN